MKFTKGDQDMHAHERTLTARLTGPDPDKKNPKHDWACQYLAQQEVGDRLIQSVLHAAGKQWEKLEWWSAPEVQVIKGGGKFTNTVGFIDLVFGVTATCIRKVEKHDANRWLALPTDPANLNGWDKLCPCHYHRIRYLPKNGGWGFFVARKEAEELGISSSPISPFMDEGPSVLASLQPDVPAQPSRLYPPPPLTVGDAAQTLPDEVWIRVNSPVYDPPRKGRFNSERACWEVNEPDYITEDRRKQEFCITVEVKTTPTPVGDVIRQLVLYRDFTISLPRSIDSAVHYDVLVTSYALDIEDVEMLQHRGIRHMVLGAPFEEYVSRRQASTEKASSLEL